MLSKFLPIDTGGLELSLPLHLLARAAVFEAGLEKTIHDAPLVGDDS